MEKKELDSLLKQSLTPDEQADAGLNAAILERLEDPSFAEQKQEKKHIRHWSKGLVVKVAAVALAVLAVGAGTTYAAGRIMGRVEVRETRLAIGDNAEAYVSREYHRDPVPQGGYDIEVTEWVMGGPNDNWLRKEVLRVGNCYNSNYYYSDYETAISDAGYPNVFTTILGKQEQVIYQTVQDMEGSNPRSQIYLDCRYGEKYSMWRLEQMQRGDKNSGRLGVSTISMPMTHSDNVRTYVSANGTEFTLVDDMQGPIVKH
ncbi:MAG: hypothetical protein J5546_07670, partial [Lachnospiraceae bacterium]|nr:hypothetical protein [Lachnospiraceae bacterium]